MPHPSAIVSRALFKSLIEAPLLLTDLPEAPAFPTGTLEAPPEGISLNLRQKLGHLYEDALAATLAATPGLTTLSRGLQLRRKAGHTLGELDFLIEDHTTRTLIHLELAIKFYLAVETESATLLPGPDARDNYFRKLEKMRTHQLVLTRKFPDLLPHEFQHREIISQQLVHGCIFDHIHAVNPVETPFLSPHGRRGKWLHAHQCSEYFGEKPHLELIPKPLWPVPIQLLEAIPLEKWELPLSFERCTMVRAAGSNIPHFIAPDNYP